MDSVLLTDSDRVLSGLEDLLTAKLGPHGYTHRYVDLPIALFIIEIAKRSEDKPEWFPSGKWATIQSISGRVDKELSKIESKHE